MNKSLLTLTAGLTIGAQPVFAASGPFFSLANTDFIVVVSFIVFIGVLIYFKVPGMLGKVLDDRAAGIQSELDEAKALKEEAQALLASYERKQADVQAQADRIVAQAKADAEAAAEQAKVDLSTSISRRMASAVEQIASAEASALKEVRDQASIVAIAAARDVIAKQLTAKDTNALIDSAIAEVEAKLH
ncbi:MAG: F0F1 ATP synthase subunit B [Paracoccaceae bacterium]